MGVEGIRTDCWAEDGNSSSILLLVDGDCCMVKEDDREERIGYGRKYKENKKPKNQSFFCGTCVYIYRYVDSHQIILFQSDSK
jgi:hypothetical protein